MLVTRPILERIRPPVQLVRQTTVASARAAGTFRTGVDCDDGPAGAIDCRSQWHRPTVEWWWQWHERERLFRFAGRLPRPQWCFIALAIQLVEFLAQWLRRMVPIPATRNVDRYFAIYEAGFPFVAFGMLNNQLRRRGVRRCASLSAPESP